MWMQSRALNLLVRLEQHAPDELHFVAENFELVGFEIAVVFLIFKAFASKPLNNRRGSRDLLL